MSDFQTWKESRNRFWRNPTGFLAVTGMHWLSETPQTFDGVSGTWWAEGLTAHATGFDGNESEQTWTIDSQSEQMVDINGGVLEIASRGEYLALRPRMANSRMFDLFDGVITYDYNPKFKVTAKLEPNAQRVAVGSVIGDIGIAYDSAGSLVFELGGETQRLTGFVRSEPGTLWIIFTDATSGKATYGTGRHVIARENSDGVWEIDFNKSANFPCAYTDFATCPLAPTENHLKVAIEAGEKTPKIKSTIDGPISL